METVRGSCDDGSHDAALSLFDQIVVAEWVKAMGEWASDPSKTMRDCPPVPAVLARFERLAHHQREALRHGAP